MLVKTEALILRTIAFRDTSKVVTAYTADHGLVSLLAKGVRGPKPRFGASLELFSHSDLVYYHRDSRELQLLGEASLLDPYLGLSGSADRYIYGMAVLEFLLKVLGGQEPPGRLYTLSQRTLEVLEDCPRRALETVFRAFELKAISFLGHRPELYACVECGTPAGETGDAGFSPMLGGIVCAACAPGETGVLPLSRSALTLFQRLLTTTLADLEQSPPGGAEVRPVGRLLEAFFQCHLERYDSLRAVRMTALLAAEGDS
jgi:DNA repair protein RecO (recombination protein O)